MSTTNYPMQYHYPPTPTTVEDIKRLNREDDPASWYTVACHTILKADLPANVILRKFERLTEQFQRCDGMEDLQIMVCKQAIKGNL